MCTFNHKLTRIKQILKRILTGLTVPQEYICVDKNGFQSPPSVFLVIDSVTTPIDVTDRHVFIGYKPVIIALILPDLVTRLEKCQHIRLEFRQGVQVIATLLLQREKTMLIGSTPIIYYVAVNGAHSFLSPFHRLINRLRQLLKKAKPGNVALDGNLYDQVRIVYCVPRVIAVITVGTADNMNMFPTDLHGALTDEYYISSLRIGGAATRQIEGNGKIALARVDASAFRLVYALGPNHMREVASHTAFECSGTTPNFQIPLPLNAVSYRELERLSSIDIGIHRLHVYRIISSHRVLSTDSTLAHIHGYYAQWRINRNIPTHMLLR
ncbi:MAG TPA: hypothetical protein VG737_08505 [Cyclobacteriaceae bacterium]|nr:hypothetical protein [Cyclobacteriaceae bacterium]